ncbi:oxidase [Capnocytophaga sp. HP1101]
MKDLLLIKNDLHLAEGDFQVGSSEPQQQKAILTAEKGQWKEHPEVGVGIAQMLADDLYTEMLIEVKKQLEYDGIPVKNVTLTPQGSLLIE